MAPPPSADAVIQLAPADFRPPAPRSARGTGNVGRFWRKLTSFAGPGYLVAVGYVDPGNWVTDLAGGSAFGYELLSVVLLSSLMAMLLQALAARLGIVAGLDLAQACRRQYGGPARIGLWLLCEVAIAACDLAELIGTAIALQLLFGLPLVAGICLTACDVMLILVLNRSGFRQLEAVIVALLIVVAGCFAIELILARPDLHAVAAGFIPRASVATNPGMLYLAIGILGATVMPHNLYLHSALVQRRKHERTPGGIREALKFATIDSTLALSLAFLVNVAILVLAASAFHATGHAAIADFRQAYDLLTPMLGASVASVLFATALLASGQSSTITATMAGQIVMEGFVDIKLAPATRRVITRLFAIVPAVVVALLYGPGGMTKLLIFSQVILSLQLPFAVVPLVRFTGDRGLMGDLANGWVLKITAWAVAAIIILLNLKLLLGLVQA